VQTSVDQEQNLETNNLSMGTKQC